MNKNETIEHYSECIDQLTTLYSKDHAKVAELEGYIKELQELCNQHKINYPPLKEPIKF